MRVLHVSVVETQHSTDALRLGSQSHVAELVRQPKCFVRLRDPDLIPLGESRRVGAADHQRHALRARSVGDA